MRSWCQLVNRFGLGPSATIEGSLSRKIRQCPENVARSAIVAIGEMLIHGGTYNALVFMTGVLVIPGEHSPSFFNSQLDFQQRMLDLSPGFIHALGPSSLAAECSTLVWATL